MLAVCRGGASRVLLRVGQRVDAAANAGEPCHAKSLKRLCDDFPPSTGLLRHSLLMSSSRGKDWATIVVPSTFTMPRSISYVMAGQRLSKLYRPCRALVPIPRGDNGLRLQPAGRVCRDKYSYGLYCNIFADVDQVHDRDIIDCVRQTLTIATLVSGTMR